MNYIISSITTYNDDEQLFETKIGKDNKAMSLLYTAHGKTEFQSRKNACDLVLLLTVAGDKFTAHH